MYPFILGVQKYILNFKIQTFFEISLVNRVLFWRQTFILSQAPEKQQLKFNNIMFYFLKIKHNNPLPESLETKKLL